MAFFGYPELLTLSASGKEGRAQSGKIFIIYRLNYEYPEAGLSVDRSLYDLKPRL